MLTYDDNDLNDLNELYEDFRTEDSLEAGDMKIYQREDHTITDSRGNVILRNID